MHYYSLPELTKLIESGEISPVEITHAYLGRIESLEPKLRSFITVLADEALEDAKKAESEILQGKYKGALHGIPYSLKDLFFTKGVRTTMGSNIYDSYITDHNSTVFDKLSHAGAVLLGKNNLNVFAYGTTGINPDYGDARNPWNEHCITGGSSSGSASAVAAGECAFSIGSDASGSIRIPASLCGIVGFKPTYGLVSTYGAFPHSWSHDHAGPMTRDVKSNALVMNEIAETENLDYTSVLTGEISGIRIGLPKEIFALPVCDEVHRAVRKAIEKLEYLGAEIEEISWPMFDKAMAISSTIKMAEATSYYGEMVKTHGPQIFEPVRTRLEAGYFIPACDYIRAQRARVLFIRESLKMIEDVDVILSPATPVTAFIMNENDSYFCEIGSETRNAVALLTQYTAPFNLNGFPAISLPCGFSHEGLPIGLQIAGKHFDEAKVYQTAFAFEQSTGLNLRIPYN
jgi:aspartyl-tRNA(Asn)/glutamyl-tRNA(Gln) amidotransferase subunit A